MDNQRGDAPMAEYDDRSVPAHIRYGADEIEELLSRRWSPAVMRWFLSCRIVDAREARGLAQGPVADALDGWSLSKVRYIERAERPIDSEKNVEQLVDFYELGKEESALWMRLWELSRAEEWWDERRLRLNPELKRLFGTEWGVHRMWLWLPAVVPVWVQTEDYTRAILNQQDPTRPTSSRLVWEEIGRQRRRLLQDEGAARVSLILDESALYRQVGHSPDVLADQLERLQSIVTDWSAVRLRVVPFSAGWLQWVGSGFQALAFHPEAEFPEVVHTEPSPLAGVKVVRGDGVERFERAFKQLEQLALDREDTVRALGRAQANVQEFAQTASD